MSAETTTVRPHTNWKRKALFAIIASLLFWGGFEVVLRVIGFSYRTDVESMQFTFPIDEYNLESDEPFLQRDRTLFWKPRPRVLGHNSHGLVGPDFTDDKPDGIFRVVCLGDSCTHFGPDSYPEQWHSLLSELAPGDYEVLNAACIGYSSYQGLARLKYEVLNWSPDLVTVYFGWNDHWLARGYRDSQQIAGLERANQLSSALDEFRIWQFAKLLRRGTLGSASPELRVSPAEYAENLTEVHRLCNERGIAVWYLTAPHAFDLGIPEYLATSGEVADITQIRSIHEHYNEIVRSVAANHRAVLCDLAAEVESMDKRRLLADDHIHLSAEGRAWVARRLLRQLNVSTSEGSSPSGQKPAFQ